MSDAPSSLTNSDLHRRLVRTRRQRETANAAPEAVDVAALVRLEEREAELERERERRGRTSGSGRGS